MNKNIIIAIGAVVVVGVAGVILMNKSDNSGEVVGAECVQICSQANEACPSLIDKTTCENKCSEFSDEVKDFLVDADSCEKLAQRPDLLSTVIVPEVNEPENLNSDKEASQDCEAACGKYVSACLTLVPNASEILFNDGYDSCLGECAKWNDSKVDCMINAFNCQAMTETCGL
jgi:hypothetical protein